MPHSIVSPFRVFYPYHVNFFSRLYLHIKRVSVSSVIRWCLLVGLVGGGLCLSPRGTSIGLVSLDHLLIHSLYSTSKKTVCFDLLNANPVSEDGNYTKRVRYHCGREGKSPMVVSQVPQSIYYIFLLRVTNFDWAMSVCQEYRADFSNNNPKLQTRTVNKNSWLTVRPYPKAKYGWIYFLQNVLQSERYRRLCLLNQAKIYIFLNICILFRWFLYQSSDLDTTVTSIPHSKTPLHNTLATLFLTAHMMLAVRLWTVIFIELVFSIAIIIDISMIFFTSLPSGVDVPCSPRFSRNSVSPEKCLTAVILITTQA